MRLRTLNMKAMDAEAAIIARIFNDAWQGNWGFVPVMAEEISALAHAFRPFLVPEFCVFVELDGEPVAVALILPNLAELTGDFGGTLLPFNWMRLLYRAIGRRGMDRILWGIAAYFFAVDSHARAASRDWLETIWGLPAGRAE